MPQTTLYWWARQRIVVPSVSPDREKLWSYADLMGLRIVSWLRHTKSNQVPASPMPQVRKALAILADLDLGIWDAGVRRSPLAVDRRGAIFVRHDDDVLNSQGHPTLLPEDNLDLTAPFTVAGLAGPDLIAPRPHLRIVPSKVAGEPHVEGSRITTVTLAALAARGYRAGQIARMYDVADDVVQEALDLEHQLAHPRLAAA